MLCAASWRIAGSQTQGVLMAWTSPIVVEVCLGMEVTSYASAQS
ncbi:MAG: pyrroloquinoline quinone precursor peptide PqqA [Hyphomicrobiales bacterium]|nr:pyrroloquinoline quinone precursor peptide PqqA [Hyphomicrobiales bacterium]